MSRILSRGTTTLAPIFIVSIALFAQQFDASLVDIDHSLWKLSLRSSGLAKQANLNESPLAIRFVDTDTLVMAWFVSHPRPSPDLAEPATLKAVYINAKTGKVRSKFEWTATSRPLGVHITSAGNLLARDGQTLYLFSPESKPPRQQEFLRSVVFGLTVSPDGTIAMVCAGSSPSAAQLINTDTLQILDAVPMIVACGKYSVGEKAILAQGDKDSGVFVRTPGEPWHALSPPASGVEPNARYTFLSEDVLAVSSRYCSQSFSIITIEGKVLSTENLPEGHCWGNIAVSPGGQYLGVPEARLRGIKNATLDMFPFPSPEQFVVYRLPDMKTIFRVKVEEISPWFVFPRKLVQQYAISPAGDRVAVMSNGVIRTYAVH